MDGRIVVNEMEKDLEEWEFKKKHPFMHTYDKKTPSERVHNATKVYLIKASFLQFWRKVLVYKMSRAILHKIDHIFSQEI